MSADRAAWKDSHAGHLHLEREFEAKTPEVCEETVRGQLVLRSGPQAQLFFLLVLHKGQRYYRLAMWLAWIHKTVQSCSEQTDNCLAFVIFRRSRL